MPASAVELMGRAMAAKRLSDRELVNAKPRATRYLLADGGGLFLEVLPSGVKSWRVEFRVKDTGRRERVTLGAYPDVSLLDARARASTMRSQVASGGNPADAERARRSNAKQARHHDQVDVARTGAALLDLYVSNVVRVKRSDPRPTERTIERFLRPALASRRVSELVRGDIEDIVIPIRDRGRPAMAGAVLRLLRQALDYAAGLGWRVGNPARELKAEEVHRARSRSRTLSQSELSSLLRSVYASNVSRAVKLAVHLLVLTGCRKSEVTGAHWGEFDEAARVWVIPAERHKMRREHTVYLSDQVLELLAEAKHLAAGSSFVFPSHKKPGVSMSSSTINQALRTLAWEGASFVVHDLRRTMETLANELGLADPHVIHTYTGHVLGGTVMRTYNRATYASERRDLAAKWGAFVADLIGYRKVIVGSFGRVAR